VSLPGSKPTITLHRLFRVLPSIHGPFMHGRAGAMNSCRGGNPATGEGKSWVDWPGGFPFTDYRNSRIEISSKRRVASPLNVFVPQHFETVQFRNIGSRYYGV
jgi:hypothetical protein